MYQEYHRDHFTISTDPSRLDVDAIHAFLTRSYWAEGIPRDIVARSLRHALCFGLYDGDKQIGLARQFGFTGLKIPERHMEILDPEVYKKRTAG